MRAQRLERIETYVLAVIEGRERSRSARILAWWLHRLSHLYGWVVQCRLWLARHGVFRHHALGSQVISIGNLTVGGTGKTPIVEVFARALQQRGRRVAILSRGYKKATPPLAEKLARSLRWRQPSHLPLVVSDGKRLLLDSHTGGDEPYMLASNLPDVVVLVDSNRVRAGKVAIRDLGCDILLLDDGFQYLSLQHRVDIVLVDSSAPFGNGHLLPRGVLRERIQNIRRASLIFLTKCDGRDNTALKHQLRTYNAQAEICECRHCPRYLQHVYTGEREPLALLRDRRIAVLSGIAAPDGFEKELRRMGARLVLRKRYADHHRYHPREIIEMINRGLEAGATMIVTTEKDAVRIPVLRRCDLPIYFLRVEIEMISGMKDFEDCIARICFR